MCCVIMNKKVVTAFHLALNILFCIVITLLNKWLYVYTKFPNITLSMIRFIIIFIGLLICQKMNVFCVKNIDIRETLFIAITFCGFVVLTNLSLAHNTVGTYQVAKMLTTPCIILIQMLFYKRHFSVLLKLTLIPIIIGVIINFYYDIQFNIIGTIYATLGVFVTSLHQILIKGKQKEFQMDPMQLLYYQAPLSAIILLVIIPLLEPVGETLKQNWTFLDIFMVLLSGIVAFFANLTSYFVIGQTSPLVHDMVGHSKFCLLLLGGAIVFHEVLPINQVIGITVSLIGNILYANVKMAENQNIPSKYIV